MKRLLLVLTVFFILPLSVAMGKGNGDFTVLSFSPEGEVSGKPEIKVIFSSTVAADDLVGKLLPGEDVPLVFSPAVVGRAVWDDPKTLVFSPDKALARATAYRATIKPLRDRSGRLLAGPQSFSFNTQPLRLKSVRQISVTPYGEMTMELRFSLPVPPKRLLGFMSGRSDGRSVRLTPQGEVPSDRIIVVSDNVPGDGLTIVVEKGLASDEGPLGLARTEKITLKPSSVVTVTGTSAESESSEKGRIVIYTSRPVDPGDVKGYIYVSPEKPFRVESVYGGFALVGAFAPRDRITVTLKKGLGGGDGLESDDARSFIMPDVDRSVSFPVTGTFLTPFDDPRIPLETVNVDRIGLRGWKLYPNNVPVVVGALGGGNTIPISLTRSLKTWELPVNNRVNETVRSAVDLKTYLGESRGVFLLEATDDDGGWGGARQLVTLTDIGLSARISSREILIWADGLSSGTALEGAKLSVYSSSNQLLAEGTTDRYGLWSYSRKTAWDPQLIPAVVVAQSGDDLTFLSLSGNLFAENGIDVSGAPWTEAYEAQCLLPRGIFRPGESVEVTSVVRGPKMSLPGRFPLIWRVIGSTGDEMYRGRTELSESGTSASSFELPDSAPSGKYRFELFIPGEEENPMGRVSFLVEDFTPPKIELGLDVRHDGPFLPGQSIDMALQADYLFGAPASGLNWEMEAFSRAVKFQSERFADFVFGDDEIRYDGDEVYLGGGMLDDSGKGSLTWTVPEEWRNPPMIELSLSLQVMEAGGRWVSRSKSVRCSLNPVQIGIRLPKGDMRPGRPIPIQVAEVTPDDRPVSSGGIDWTLFSLIDRPVLVRDDGRTRMRWEEEKSEVCGGTVSLKEGLADLSVVPEEGGRYLLTLSGDGGSCASVRFEAWEPWGESSGGAVLPDRVELSLDKDAYITGDDAVLSYKAPFAGVGLFTFEADGMIDHRVVDVSEPEGEVRFAIAPKAWPNGWCTFQVIRPVSENDKWTPHRALGAIPVSVDPGFRASLSMDVPGKVDPGGRLELSVEIKDDHGNPASGDLWIALVDRGILGLTDHDTPDPWKAFTARRTLNSRASDLYDELIPIESRETPLLHPAGGDSREAMFKANLSPVKARGFKVLSLVRTGLPVKDGATNVSFDLPEFSGGARVMAVFSGRSIGSAQADVSVSRPVTVDPTIPEALAPGDVVLVPVQLISTADEDVRFHMDVSAGGSISMDEPLSGDFRLAPGENDVKTLKIRASDEAGSGVLSVRVVGEGLNFSVERETVIRPPMPRITVSGSGVLETGTFEMPDNGRWFPGTLRTSLYLSGAPRADLMPVVGFLDRYPYGCLEQTVSALWPSVVLGDMAEKIGTSGSVADRVARLQTMQLYDGSFSSWPEGDKDAWGSLYAAHLLLSMEEGVIPGAMIDRTEGYLRSVLSETAESAFELSQKAYASYVMSLAGQPPLGWMAWLSERIGEMDSAGRSLLAGAYGLAGKKEVGLKLIGAESVPASDRYGSSIRDMALKLLAVEDLAPGSPEESFLASKLSEAIESGDYSTQEAGLAVLTLGRFADRTDVKPFSAEVTGGDKKWSIATGDELLLSSDKFVRWKVDNSGPGRLFCGWSLSGVPLDPVRPFDKGLSVRRSLLDREGKKIDLSKSLSLGEEVTVSIEVTPTGTVNDLVVVDLLPGCLEVWNSPMESSPDSTPIRRDVRFDRVLFFPARVDKTMKLEYRCRVTARGEFLWPPVSAEGMYDSSFRSMSGGGRITVE